MNEENEGPTEVKTHLYNIEDGEIKQRPQACPICGGGVFLAQHENRVSCGRCGYTKYLSEEDEE